MSSWLLGILVGVALIGGLFSFAAMLVFLGAWIKWLDDRFDR